MSVTQPHATPEQQRTKPATVGFYLGVLGLGLIFLGGCFLIGVMIMQFAGDSNGTPPGGSPSAWFVFLSVLYVLAILCFGGGIFVMYNAVRRLMAS